MGYKLKTDYEFEIRFYEDILKKTPTFVEVLIALGELYTKKGRYEKGLEIDLRLVQLRPYNPYVLYNLACSHSLLNDTTSAYAAMQKAFECGYRDFAHLEKDQDLVNLRQQERFQKYLLEIKNKSLI